MRVEDFFPPEVIDEDIRKWMGGALAAGALATTPAMLGHEQTIKTPSPLAVLAQTMWGEARGEGTLGMLAIGFVIKNRAESDHHARFGSGIAEVALKHKQFSCWNMGDPNREAMKQMKAIDGIIKSKKPPAGEKSYADWLTKFKQSKSFGDYKAWRKAFDLAGQVLDGSAKDPTKGATFYHATAVHPDWANEMDPVSKLADHVFYRLPSEQG
jgi:N-acetylmuramoyl-L-alanine amidase